VERRRTFKSSTRCDCPFKITYRMVQKSDKSNKSVVLTGSCIYRHANGCFPSTGQLNVERRKSGMYSRAVHQSQITTILTVLNTKQKISARLLRDLVRPMFPPSQSLHAQFLINFRRKAQSSLDKKKIGAVHQISVTPENEAFLLSADSLPRYYTIYFLLLDQCIRDASLRISDTQQIDTFLQLLAHEDPSFKYRRVTNPNGDVTGYVWQT
jgi:hypothetical protein